MSVRGKGNQLKVTSGRPNPPEDLTAAQAQEWVEIVNSSPEDRFPRSTWPMLLGYVTHASNMRALKKVCDGMPERLASGEVTLMEYNRALGMFHRESSAVASFGVRLGIARTSRAGRHNGDPDQIDRGVEGNNPWDD